MKQRTHTLGSLINNSPTFTELEYYLNTLNQLDVTLWKFFLLLNMFRMLLHSSSGAGDCMWVYCSVMIDVYALASCLLAIVYLWVCLCVVCYYNVSWISSIVEYCLFKKIRHWKLPWINGIYFKCSHLI